MSKRLLFFLSLVLLSGCVAKSIDRQAFPLPENVQSLERWQLDGRIALKNDTEGFSAGLSWTETPESYVFELNGPLGETRARLNASATLSTLELPNEPVLTGTNTEQLIADHFGWAVPVSSLKHWVRGLPDAQSQDLQFDDLGRLLSFNSNGWHVKYLAWQEVHGLTLPKRLEATHHQLSLKLSLHDWEF